GSTILGENQDALFRVGLDNRCNHLVEEGIHLYVLLAGNPALLDQGLEALGFASEELLCALVGPDPCLLVLAGESLITQAFKESQRRCLGGQASKTPGERKLQGTNRRSRELAIDSHHEANGVALDAPGGIRRLVAQFQVGL